jgi:hypothetical protein
MKVGDLLEIRQKVGSVKKYLKKFVRGCFRAYTA